MRSLRVVQSGKERVPWMVAVPASFTGTRRVRKYFADKERATAYVISVKRDGFVTVENTRSSAGKVTVGEAAALWLARHEQQRVSTGQLRHVLKRMVARFGRDPVDAITHREIDTWLRSLDAEGLAPVTVHNCARITRRFFNYCRDWLEVVVRNPFVKIKERPLEHKDPAILTPSEMKSCLDAAAGDRRLTAFLCLAGFAGLRTAEILRQRWEDIDWHGEIYVKQPKRVGGWRPRRVEILPALRRHLEPIALPAGKVLPGGEKTLYQLRREMMNRIGMDRWPNNCLRHSYKSYHYAFWRDGGKTAAECGHAPSVSYYVYGSPTTKADAAAWWEL